MNYKHSFCIVLGIVASFIILFCTTIMGIIYLSDPFQVRNKGYFNIASQRIGMRLEAQSIITNVDFESAIVGTSMLANTSAREASELFNEKYVNLSIDGANFYERSLILNRLLQNKKVKSIIYSFGEFYLDFSEQSKDLSRWELLYDENKFNDYIVAYDKQYIKMGLRLLLRRDQKKAEINDFSRPYAWNTSKSNMKRFGGLHNWVNSSDIEQVSYFLNRTLPQTVASLPNSIPPLKPTDYNDASLKYINNYVIGHIKNNPQTVFHVLLPPYYRYYYAEWRQVYPHKYHLHTQAIRHLVQASEKYPNLIVYGFENLDYASRIENYKDIKHYHPEFNSFMLKAIKEKSHILTKHNVETYLEECDNLAKEFNILQFYEKVQTLNQNKR